MVREALADAGLTIDDVDGVCYGGTPPGIAEYLGIHPRFVDGTMTGGSSYEIARRARGRGHRGRAVRRRGRRVHGDPTRRPGPQERRRAARARCPDRIPMFEWEMPYGLRMPMGAYALAASRHMAEYGTTSEQLAQIAVDTRRWASLNPRRAIPRADHDRRRARVADAGVAAASPRLLPRDRRRGRVRDDVGRPGSRPGEGARLRARRRDVHRPFDDLGDARPRDRLRGRSRGPPRSSRRASPPTKSTC